MTVSHESLSSGMSLYDELSQLDGVEQHGENTSIVSYSSDNDSCIMVSPLIITKAMPIVINLLPGYCVFWRAGRRQGADSTACMYSGAYMYSSRAVSNQ